MNSINVFVRNILPFKPENVEIESFGKIGFGGINFSSYVNGKKQYRFRREILTISLLNGVYNIRFGPDFFYGEDGEFFENILSVLKHTNSSYSYSKKEYKKLQKQAQFRLPENISLFNTYSSKCYKAEKSFYFILEPTTAYYKRGILVYHNKNLIGLLKLKYNRTLLSLKLDENSVPLQKLTVYDIPQDWAKQINQLPLKKTDWTRVNIEGNFKVGKYTKELKEFNAILNLNDQNLSDEAIFNIQNSKKGFKKELITRIHQVYEENKNISSFDLEITSYN